MQENKSIYKKLFTIVAPIAVQYFMYSLVSASDAFMLGFLDQDSLSASSLAGQVWFVSNLFNMAFVSGLTVLAAQYWGKGDKRTTEEVLAITMRYSLLVGLLFTLAALFIPRQLMMIFTSDKVLIAEGAKYLRVVSPSYLMLGFSQVYFSMMKVCDRAKLSSVVCSVSVVLNIIMNGLFIFGVGFFPKMGIIGAALATVLSRVFEVVMVVIAVFKGKCLPLSVKLMLKNGSKELHKDYWRYTVPLLLNQLGWGGGVTMYSVIMGRLGSDAVAANAIASIVRSMIASLCWGIAAGVGIIIGGMLGRNETQEAKKAGGKFVRLSIWIGVGSGLVILAVTPLLMSFITLNEKANYYMKFMMFMAAYYIIGNSLNSTIIGGIFPAGGDTRFGMICDIVTLWCVVVPMGAIAAFVLKLPVLAVAFILTLDEFVKIPAVYKHYVKYKWVKNITR
ncbi:MAG: MATE family efflux transporter [Ruminococcus sp.]|uniref:MATE family efflux transporter n=1 Tax=Ruminococcus sp. TaxID=41978 RepID=UPI0025FC040F|nr:MATE family efflux transporter [Ruminococcus sp.]MCR4794681.1 MATE family efflux transporter [Ruminococcus sp.]